MAKYYDCEDYLYNEFKEKYQDPWSEHECISALQDRELNEMESRWEAQEKIKLMYMSFGY